MGLFDELLKKPPQPANDGTATAGSQTQGSIAVVSEPDPLQIQTPITKTEEQAIATEGTIPSATPTVSIEPSTPATTAETDASSILVNSEPSEEVAPIVESVSPPIDTIDSTEIMPVKEEAPAVIVAESAPAENVDLGSLFGEDIPAETEIEVTPAPAPERTDSVDESEFVNLNAYIEANISQTESLIAKIDAAHTEKLEEAAGYKSEKERFAELEESAYEDAEKMMVEKAHTERMKAYFMEQLDEAVISSSSPKKDTISATITSPAAAIDEPPYDEPPMYDDVMLMEDASIDGSVETALTGMAVQNTVNSTMEKKHKTKKHEEKKEESLMTMIGE